MSTTVLERTIATDAGLTVVDCDIHPSFRKPGELADYLPERWRQHMARFGARIPQPLAGTIGYPRVTAGNGARMDAAPPSGGPAGSDLDFMRHQLLDLCNIEYGLLQPLGAGSTTNDQDLGAALCTAVNQWQIDHWTGPEKRLKGAICVTQDDPPAAIKEIERWAGHGDFVQVAIPPRSLEPIGRRRYWPVLEAAAAANLPIGMHSAAYGPHTNSAGGWLSYYIEEHYAFAHSLQTVITSLVMEGCFERFPNLKVVCIEGGFAWAPPLAWRLDKAWARMRDELPHVKRPPSEYIREHVWYTTQPVEEPETPAHLRDTIEWLGWDRLMFSTDYPHWDFDDPRYAFKIRMSAEERRKLFRDNAKALYRLV